MKLIFLLLISFSSFGQNYSLRDCMVLPITDSAGEVLGYKVFDEVESYLKRSGWCNYKSSSEILSIFSKYRDRLKTHLENPSVIKTVAKKLKVGSLIKIGMSFDIDSVVLNLEIFSQEGSELLFRESQKVPANLDSINSKLVDWLETYEKSIPYSSQVIGVLGEQVTFDKLKGIEIGQGFEVRRFLKKKKHKLLKSVVQWDSELIAKGKVYNTTDDQVLGLVKSYFGNSRIRSGDWIVVKNSSRSRVSDKKFFPNFEKRGDFGKLGELTVSFLISNSSVNTSPTGKNLKYGNFIYGLSVEAEAWVTRNYFALGELSRSVGSLDLEGGVATEGSPSTINGVFKIGGGYKHLPLGYFFGPQLNLYGGYASYSYGLDQSAADGIGEGTLSGIFIGAGGNTPVKKDIRIFANLEFMPITSFKDEDNVYSGSSSESHFSLEFGGKYKYRRIVDIKGSLELNNARVKFSGGSGQVRYKDTIVKIGASFIF